jgi:hypothetical protein
MNNCVHLVDDEFNKEGLKIGGIPVTNGAIQGEKRVKETQSPRAVQKRSETRESSKFAETASLSHFSRPLSHHFHPEHHHFQPFLCAPHSHILLVAARLCIRMLLLISCSSSSHIPQVSSILLLPLLSPRMTGCFRTLSFPSVILCTLPSPHPGVYLNCISGFTEI